MVRDTQINISAKELAYMSHALKLAEKGLYSTKPNPRVGCVIVNDDKVVGEGYHAISGEAHAEINALSQASGHVENSEVYVTLEPCSHYGQTPPCADALIRAGVAKVFVAMTDPNPQVSGSGIKKLRNAGIEVVSGLLENEAKALNPGFIKRMQAGVPYVTCKLAMSLDGRTSMASGESQWITSPASRQDVHKLRARSCAILTGSGTVIADDPSLNVRLEEFTTQKGGVLRQPHRVVLDTHLRTPHTAKCLKLPGAVIIFHASENKDKIAQLEHNGASMIKIDTVSNRLNMNTVLEQLAQFGINEVLVEAGPVLAGSLLKQNLVDEFRIYMASHIMGDSANGLFNLPDIHAMKQRIPLQITDIRAIGPDWRIIAKKGY